MGFFMRIVMRIRGIHIYVCHKVYLRDCFLVLLFLFLFFLLFLFVLLLFFLFLLPPFGDSNSNSFLRSCIRSKTSFRCSWDKSYVVNISDGLFISSYSSSGI